MRIRHNLGAAFLVLLAACGSQGSDPAEPGDRSENMVSDGNGDPSGAGDSVASSAGWDLSSGERGITLALLSRSGPPVIRFFCPSGQDELQLHVSGFRPVGSEERMTFGSGGNAHTLVADPGSSGGGVSASGRVPGNLSALIGGPVSVNYGSQDSGPHGGPEASVVRRFASACRAEVPAQDGGSSGNGDGSVSACLVQDGNRLRNPPLRAIGTEPFWNARTNGRCVTYTHPEDQDGTRIWTTYTPGSDGTGTWSGALGDRLFELTIRPRPGCSDGMSDRRYPSEAELKVHGEVRRGCAEPAQSR